ncbi:MAG TPA: N,N-dimethylformamidase beta subunit family domain-containing protein [Gaiella sp.]|nr:N,N-dimethylformamidase beta subunit family domain-containing protein [Gaiella sp.]
MSWTRALTALLISSAAVFAGAVHAAPRSAPVEAAFRVRSASPGETAVLDVWTPVHDLRVEILRVGPGGAHQPLGGRRVARFASGAARAVRVEVGRWESGVYAASLRDGRRRGWAVLVVRPRRLGAHRVAVVMPTNTWQAYNRRDVDDDGTGDTWYETPAIDRVDLRRPFLDGGVPPHFRSYDRGFLHWLARRHHAVDYLADDDFERIASGDRLAELYDLIVFPGHEEYVSTHAYDVLERFRDLGGNLAFLSANNVFYRVERRGRWLVRTGRWRDVGRPEAALVGVQYLRWNENRYRSAPYVVTGAQRAPWLFRGTRLANGDRFGSFGIEIDTRTSDSPRGIRVLARIPDVFGPGRSAEMTYYTTPRGAKVFAAGAFTLGGAALWPSVSPLLDNLWRELSAP